MAHDKDWLPGKRDDILAMARVWSDVLGTQASAWGIPAAELPAFTALLTTADAALQAAKAERSPVTIQTCRAAFDALIEKMRFLKNHYFLIPPLTDSDLISLLLPIKDTTHSTIPAPSNQVTAKVRPLGPALLELLMEILGDAAADPHVADYGFSIFYRVLADGEPVPDTPETFLHHGFTRRKKELINRPESERGRKICFCIKLENAKGRQGPWGPVFWTIIP